MPVLGNARHERFARWLFEGKSADEAYTLAGFTANRGNAARLKANEAVKARIAELLEGAAEKAEVTQSRIFEELAKIGFADIRKIIKWHSQVSVAQIDDDADTEALIDEGEIRFAVANQVELISSKDVDDATAAAISEVSMTAQGGLKVKLYDKRAALVDMGKHLGMFKELHELTGKDGGPIEYADMNDTDALRRMRFLMDKASREQPKLN